MQQLQVATVSKTTQVMTAGYLNRLSDDRKLAAGNNILDERISIWIQHMRKGLSTKLDDHYGGQQFTKVKNNTIGGRIFRKTNLRVKDDEQYFGKSWWFVGPFNVGKTEIDVDPLSCYQHILSGNGSLCDRSAILRKFAGCPAKFHSDIATGIHNLDIRIRAKGNLQFRYSISQIRYTKPSKTLLISNTLEQSELPNILEGELPFHGFSWLQIPITNLANEWLSNLHIKITNYNKNKENFIPTVIIDKNTDESSNELNYFQHILAPLHTQLFAFKFHLQHPNSTSTSSTDKYWWKKFDNKICISFKITVYGTSNNTIIESNEITINLICRHKKQSFIFTFPDHDGSITHAAAILPQQIIEHQRQRQPQQQPLQEEGKEQKEGKNNLEDYNKHPSIDNTTTSTTNTTDTSSTTTADPFTRNIISYPVLLSLSGVGVTAQSQADSHKYKVTPGDKDYSFGFRDMWVLAPARSGAHNWEGTGLGTAIRSLEYLGTLTVTDSNTNIDRDTTTSVADVVNVLAAAAADMTRVVLGGHSRGGHGVLTLATHCPDRFLAVATASGYADRENYGDANSLFDVDLQMSYMDPLLIAIHMAMIHEYDNAQSISNLKGLDVLVRSGSADRTVNPYFQRLIARILSAEGFNVTYSEKSGADHWYWDFDTPEDGGVVFDPLTRAFIHSHFGIRIISVSSRLKRGKLDIKPIEKVNINNRRNNNNGNGNVHSSNDNQHHLHHDYLCTWQITPSNVREFIITPKFWERFGCDITTTTTTVTTTVTQSTPSLIMETETDTIDTMMNTMNRNIVKIHNDIIEVEDTSVDIHICFDYETASSSTSTSTSSSPSADFNDHSHSHSDIRRKKWKLCPIIGTIGNRNNSTTSSSSSGFLTTEILLDAARYLSLGHLYASSTIAPIILDTDVDIDLYDNYDNDNIDSVNWILLGGPDENKISQYLYNKIELNSNNNKDSNFPPIRFVSNNNNVDNVQTTTPSKEPLLSSSSSSSIFFGSCNLTDISQESLHSSSSSSSSPIGIMFTFPMDTTTTTTSSSGKRTNRRTNRLGIMLVANSEAGLQDVISFSFSSNTPLTRAPFSNMYGDYFITGPDLRKKGLGGVIAAGFWGDNWSIDPLNGWYPEQCEV
eukprot:gene3130-6156_t